MNWKDLLKDYCCICKQEIFWEKRSASPDLDYYGHQLQSTGIYWHYRCIFRYIEQKNQ